MKTLKDYDFINTGKTVTLHDLIMSKDIADNSIIEVSDHEGKFLVKGTPYRDCLADYYFVPGIAHKAETSLVVNFRLS